MRRIAVINQKGGVGKTTTVVNLGAALARLDRRVVLVDMDAQANLSLHLGVETPNDQPSTYTILLGSTKFADAVRTTKTPNLSLVPSNIDLSGAELELASAIGRENLLRDSVASWVKEHREREGRAPADYLLYDCPPSLGLLSINALAAADEVLITLQTEFFALQGMSKLVEVVRLLRRRLNPSLVITGILPCLYDSRLKLGREVLGEIRAYFSGQVFQHPIRTNVKLAEAPSYGQTIFEYAEDSNGARDYLLVAKEVLAQEARDPELAGLTATQPPAPTPAATPPATPKRKAPAVVRKTAAVQPDGEPALAEVELRPQPKPRAKPADRPADKKTEGLHRTIVRAKDLPPLPQDAFESMTSYVREPL